MPLQEKHQSQFQPILNVSEGYISQSIVRIAQTIHSITWKQIFSLSRGKSLGKISRLKKCISMSPNNSFHPFEFRYNSNVTEQKSQKNYTRILQSLQKTTLHCRSKREGKKKKKCSTFPFWSLHYWLRQEYSSEVLKTLAQDPAPLPTFSVPNKMHPNQLCSLETAKS